MKYAKVPVIAFCLMFLAAACSKYSVDANLNPDSVKPGGEGEVVVRLNAGMGWKIDPDSMVMIKLTPTEEISLQKRELFGEDRGPDNTFSTRFTVEENASSGDYSVGVEAIFSICREDLCKLIKHKEDLDLKVR